MGDWSSGLPRWESPSHGKRVEGGMQRTETGIGVSCLYIPIRMLWMIWKIAVVERRHTMEEDENHWKKLFEIQTFSAELNMECGVCVLKGRDSPYCMMWTTFIHAVQSCTLHILNVQKCEINKQTVNVSEKCQANRDQPLAGKWKKG